MNLESTVDSARQQLLPGSVLKRSARSGARCATTGAER